ncbi:MAG: PQQ-binding-like beta-propeller repeat protein [Planctomycetota bacterium]|nr:PQQ-binding-like beta-propeller repeat protein [Planctomycetota bacterium]
MHARRIGGMRFAGIAALSASVALAVNALAADSTLAAASGTNGKAGSGTGDWPQWGGTDARTMASPAKGIPESFDPGPKLKTGEYELSKGKNVKWVARLGSYCCGTPTVSGGKVFVGTNNVAPRDPKYKGERGVVMCFEEATGKFLWQCALPAIPKMGNANMFFAQLGICSSPLVDGERVYFVTNRAELLCVSTNGLGDGKNEGPYKDEALLYAPFVGLQLNPELVQNGRIVRAKKGLPIWVWKQPTDPVTLSATDADVIWRYDMLNDLPCWVQDAASCSPLVHGDYLYVCTPNGVEESHRILPTPDAPAIIVMDKKTGKVVATDDAKIGPRTLHGSWSSPSLGQAGGKTLLFLAAPDGVCYAFDPKPVPSESGGVGTLKKVWSFDGNLQKNRFTDPRKCNYASHNKPGAEGPSEYIATPAFHEGRVYVANGQDPRHGPGPAVLSCIDASKEGDITDSGKVWQYTDLNRTLSTVSIADGLLFIGDLKGAVHCLDAATGKPYWVHPTESPMWGSTFAVDGKVFVGNEKGDLWVLAASKELKVLSKINLGAPIYATPIVANGVLYVATNKHLFAVQQTNRQDAKDAK